MSRFDSTTVAFAAAAWPLKAAEEYRSAAVYASLQAAILLAGLPLDFAAVVGGVATDEIEHAALALHVAAMLGSTDTPAADASLVERRLEGRDAGSRVLALLLVEVAMGETASCALFRAGRDGATEPCTRAALGRILRDEARHARLGWEALATLVAECTGEERDFLQHEATSQLGAMETTMAVPALRNLESGRAFDPHLTELGVLLPERRVETFYDAIEGSIIPRLARLGLDGEGAWARRHRA